jgi:hypothetical protein
MLSLTRAHTIEGVKGLGIVVMQILEDYCVDHLAAHKLFMGYRVPFSCSDFPLRGFWIRAMRLHAF